MIDREFVLAVKKLLNALADCVETSYSKDSIPKLYAAAERVASMLEGEPDEHSG